MNPVSILVSFITLASFVSACLFALWLVRTLKGSLFQGGVLALGVAGLLAIVSRAIDLFTGIYGRQEPLDTMGDVALALSALGLVGGGVILYRAWIRLSKPLT